MYLECLSCPDLGVSCNGPNCVAMSAHDLLEWCKARKAALGMSRVKLAELSGIPKGTIDRLFAGDYTDFKYETIRHLVKALVGGDWGDHPCAKAQAEEDKCLHEMIARLEEENAQMKEKLSKEESAHSQTVESVKTDNQETVMFLKEQLKIEQGRSKHRTIAIAVLGILLGIILTLMITALTIDRLNPEVGFFWRSVAAAVDGIADNLTHPITEL